MYAFLGMQSSKTGLILVLEGVVFHYIWLLKCLFGTVTIYSDIFFKHFCLKMQNWESKKKKEKKKKLTLTFQYFGSVGKEQTNIFFFLAWSKYITNRQMSIVYFLLP